jgi:aspartyl-tRNA(Asn)/glutamyl-tRNA(Gln) amidotransferase subunit A
LAVAAVDYVRVLRRHQELKRIASTQMNGLDGWITPTTSLPTTPISDFAGVDRSLQMAAVTSRNTQPMNMFGPCGTSTPVHSFGSRLPVGLQLSCHPFEEDRTLAIALALEQHVGLPPAPDLPGFI